MFIQDPIHGYIKLDETEEKLIATESFQRLRRLKQLGFTNLVYPSTTHTRFEHSLGAAYLAGQFADSLGLDEDEKRHLRAAALLHDVGHGPFSHTSEVLFEKNGIKHEDFSVKKIKHEQLSEVLEDNGLSTERVARLVRGETRLGQLMAGDIDVDRMDYLMRDSYYSGVAHGTIDAETLMRAATIRDGKLVFRSKFKQALEGLLTARYLMIPTVYKHRAVLRAEKMMERAMERFIEGSSFDIEELAAMDDVDLKYRLRHTDVERARYLNSRLDARDIFKTALSQGADDVGKDRLRELASEESETELEREIAETAGLDERKVLADLPDIPRPREIEVEVLKNGEVVQLEEISELTTAINRAAWEQTMFAVYTPQEEVDRVKKAAEQLV